jgi:membrane protein
MGFIKRSVTAARRSDKRAWLAGIVLLAAYGVGSLLPSRTTSAVPAAHAVKTQSRPRGGWRFWKLVLLHTYAEYNEDRILMLAGAVAFYAVLALVPALTAAVSLYALFSDPASVESQFNHLRGIMPSTSFDLIQQQIERIVSDQHGNGIWFVAGVAIALWSAMSGTKGLIDSLNVVYEVEEQRSFLRYNLVALAITLAGIAGLFLAILGLVGIPLVLDHLPLGGFGKTLADWLRWPALLLILMLALAALYRFGPHRKRPRWEWVSPGNLFAAAAWLIESAALSWYLGNFANYNATYGSLGAAVALMLWLWITAVIVLLGAELNSEYYKMTSAPGVGA